MTKGKKRTDPLKSGAETVPIIFVKKYTHAILGHGNSFQTLWVLVLYIPLFNGSVWP